MGFQLSRDLVMPDGRKHLAKPVRPRQGPRAGPVGDPAHGDPPRVAASVARTAPPSRQAALADLCQRHTLATHAPATVLTTLKHEYLFSLGPTERYLRVAPGHATLDVLAMVGGNLRTPLRSAILRAIRDNAPVIVSGGRTIHEGRKLAFNIEVRPVLNDDEELLLIHFVDQPEPEARQAASPADAPRVTELERELRTTRAELQGAVCRLEFLGDEQKAINETALSANEALTALNSHLREALEAARRTAELANAAKSRFLAAASHDLRQPLQTLALLQGLLARRVEGTVSAKLVDRLDDIVSAMSAMLSTLLDNNQIEAGAVRAETVDFSAEVPVPFGDPMAAPRQRGPSIRGHTVHDGPIKSARLAGTVLVVADDPPAREPAELAQATQELIAPLWPTNEARPTRPPGPARGTFTPTDAHVIFIVDDDPNIRETIRMLLEDCGRTVRSFATGEAFLAAYEPGSDGCLLIDAYLPGMGGLELLQRLRADGDALPAIMITGSSDVPMAVQAMKAGAADFIEKPIGAAGLLASIDRALEGSRDSSKLMAWQVSAAEHIASLTPRQHQIMDLVLAGHPSKNIAADLGISQRTVENHRASIMRITGTKSLPALARLALAAVVVHGDGITNTGTAAEGRETPRAAE